jgi:hypothetical protein
MIGVQWMKHSLRVIFGANDLGPHNAGTCGGMNPDAYYMFRKCSYILKIFHHFLNIEERRKMLTQKMFG